MLHLAKHILMVILVKNSPLKHSTNFTLFLIYPYGFQFSSMIALNVKQTNTSLSNLKTFLLLFLFSKMLLTLTLEFLWTLKALFLQLLKTTPTSLSSSTHSATLLLLTQLLLLLLNMQFKLFSITGSQSLALNTLLQTEVMNI